jgi:hypothetical protein
MNPHKDIVRNAYHKEKRVPVREQDASYPDGRKQVEDGLLRCQRSFLTASLFAVGTEVGQGYEGTLWRMANNNSQELQEEDVQRKKTRRGRFWQWTEFGQRSGWEWMQLLIIPIVIGVAGLWFNWVQDARQREDAQTRAEAQLEAE